MTGVPDRGERAFVCRDPEGEWIREQAEIASGAEWQELENKIRRHARAEHLKESREMEAWQEAKHDARAALTEESDQNIGVTFPHEHKGKTH